MGPPRDLAVRPLGLGEIVDRAIALARRHFGPLFLAMLVLEAPARTVARLQQARAGELRALLRDPARLGEALAPLSAFAGGLLAVLFALQLAGTAAAAAIVAPSLDPLGARPAIPRRALAVATSGAVQLAALAAAAAAGALPGAVLYARAEAPGTELLGLAGAVAGSAGLLVFGLLRLVLVPAVAGVEGRGGIAALLRSWRLMAPRAGPRLADRPTVRALLVLLATSVLVLAVNGVAGIPRVVAGHLSGATGPLGVAGGTLPLALEVPISLLEAAASAALQPFSLVAVAVLYFDRRARTEAPDAAVWAAELQAGP